MDNFLKGDIDKFIISKSLDIFESINNTKFNKDFIEIIKFPLSGISNTIYKVEITNKTNDSHSPRIRINHLFFKVFGRISILVDRELETFLMNKLYHKGFGPEIYDTDAKTYRIEEYLEGYKVLHPHQMLDENILSKMIENFVNLNIIGGEIGYYLDLISGKSKSDYFKILKDKDKNTNIINFLLKKMKPLALTSFYQFKERYVNDPLHSPEQSDWDKKIKHIEFILTNLDDILYEICPDKGLFVIGHNDSHPLNILINSDHSKAILCDYEYSAYNYIGFDIVNYLIESCYYLSADEFPFYQIYREKLKLLENGEGYYYFLNFFEVFENNNCEIFKKDTDVKDLLNYSKTKEYFYSMMGISSLLWFTFAVIYYEYDSIKTRSGYDYLFYSLDRLMIYEKYARPNVLLDDICNDI